MHGLQRLHDEACRGDREEERDGECGEEEHRELTALEHSHARIVEHLYRRRSNKGSSTPMFALRMHTAVHYEPGWWWWSAVVLP